MCALVKLQSVVNGAILSVGSTQGIESFVEMHCGSECNYEHYLTPLLPAADKIHFFSWRILAFPCKMFVQYISMNSNG